MPDSASFADLLARREPVLALAPMQDVTDLPFWTLMTAYGGADLYYTEYFRVLPQSRLDRNIIASIERNPTGRPVVAQMIGNDIPALVRTARELQKHAVAAIDLNLGCPAPVVYRKCAGGGLLRDLPRIDAILGALREAITIPFTVKTRLGFASPDAFADLLSILGRHSLDLLTVHGRTVLEMYRSEVHYEYIAEAVAAMACPVLANGNVTSVTRAEDVLRQTGAHGLMIGRGAIANPWIFTQIREHQQGRPMLRPSGREVLAYVSALYAAVCSPDVSESAQVQKMKKYLNFVAAAAEPTGEFLDTIRRVNNKADFFQVCRQHLEHDEPLDLEPPAAAGSGKPAIAAADLHVDCSA